MTNLVTVNGVRGYKDGAVAMLNLEDVCRGLGFVQTKSGKEYVRWDRVNDYLGICGIPHVMGKDDFIPENIFYKLTFKATNETAIAFQNKVCDEILPAIRETGMYATQQTMESLINNPDMLIGLATKLKEQQQQIALQQTKIKEDAPKVEYHDTLMASCSLYDTTEIAKELGMTSAIKLNRFLNFMGVCYSRGGKWYLYAQYCGKGYDGQKTWSNRGHSGTTLAWTEAGRKFIKDMWNKHNK